MRCLAPLYASYISAASGFAAHVAWAAMSLPFLLDWSQTRKKRRQARRLLDSNFVSGARHDASPLFLAEIEVSVFHS